MKYKAFAFDLDGTLTNSDKIIPADTISKIKELGYAGNIIILASGRPLIGVLSLSKQLDFDKFGGYIICLNGAAIYNCKTQEYLLDTFLPKECVASLFRYSRKVGIASLTYDNKAIVTEKPNDSFVAIEARNNNLEIKGVDDICEYVDYPVEKIMFVGEPNLILSFIDDLKSSFPFLSIYRSDPYFLEIMNKGIDKKHALSILLNNVGLCSENLVSFGDGINDIPMLDYSGLPIAMDNSSDELKRHCVFVTKSNDENGVLFALNKIEKGEL